MPHRLFVKVGQGGGPLLCCFCGDVVLFGVCCLLTVLGRLFPPLVRPDRPSRWSPAHGVRQNTRLISQMSSNADFTIKYGFLPALKAPADGLRIPGAVAVQGRHRRTGERRKMAARHLDASDGLIKVSRLAWTQNHGDF